MSAKPLNFQQVIMRLHAYFADQGCLIWQPYSEKVGAGTGNPATALRVLGPEPWNVAYAEPSYRPDDGRYAENPNRMQMHTQFQVILKPAPANPQEVYLGSLAAIGIDRNEHDIRFVEDNWESPALGAWGLGWEVWLDGQEISQFTYFQQAGGFVLDPVAVELTYGLERIVMYLQRVNAVWDIDWDGQHTYGDILRTPEIENCVYDFEIADVARLRQMFELFEAEARSALAHRLVLPAHDYVLRCSHTFNLLDTRGAIGVTERAAFFARMRDLSRSVAALYVEQRQEQGFPWLAKMPVTPAPVVPAIAADGQPTTPQAFLLEIGTEELPVGDLADALSQLRTAAPRLLDDLRLAHGAVTVTGTPRRLVVLVDDLAPRQADEASEVKGPPADRAFDAAGAPTPAAQGFARSRGIAVSDLHVQEEGGRRYVFATVREAGRPAAQVLAEALPGLVAGIKFGKNMRWNSTNIAFSRPIRWLVALLGEQVVPFQYAGLVAGATTRGPRFTGAAEMTIPAAAQGLPLLTENRVLVDRSARRAEVAQQVAALAAEVNGRVPDDAGLLDEVTDLVEYPTALRGEFAEAYLALPKDVLVTVMKKHQRYFPVLEAGSDRLLPYFIAVRNGDAQHLDVVCEGNEGVLRARFADASFFYEADRKQPLAAFTPRLATLMFQERLGSMLDKVHRVERLAPAVGQMLGLSDEEQSTLARAAQLFKSDLVTQMVVELTSLQGTMGREYARLSGESDAVANAIFEHYLPRSQGDMLPSSGAGLALGLANRLDSLVGLFAVGLAPTGSADPFGLRRDALGIVQALIGLRRPFDLRPALEIAAAGLPEGAPATAGVQAAVLNFLRDRLYGLLRDEGLPHDVVNAVLAERAADPYRAYLTAQSLARLVAEPDWPDVLTAYARCKRIVRTLPEIYPVNAEYYSDPASAGLYQAWRAADDEMGRSANWQEANATDGVDPALSALAGVLRKLQPAINRFFTDILVMAEDPALRAARLALVQRIAALPNGIADLSQLQGF